MKNISELRKQYEEIGKEIEKLESNKDWPDSFEEARRISQYWGIETEGTRYLILMEGPAEGLAVIPIETLTIKEDMCFYWRGSGVYRDGDPYRFVKFDTAADLYRWLLEGE